MVMDFKVSKYSTALTCAMPPMYNIYDCIYKFHMHDIVVWHFNEFLMSSEGVAFNEMPQLLTFLSTSCIS